MRMNRVVVSDACETGREFAVAKEHESVDKTQYLFIQIHVRQGLANRFGFRKTVVDRREGDGYQLLRGLAVDVGRHGQNFDKTNFTRSDAILNSVVCNC
jgi:hypothetical protein